MSPGSDIATSGVPGVDQPAAFIDALSSGVRFMASRMARHGKAELRQSMNATMDLMRDLCERDGLTDNDARKLLALFKEARAAADGPVREPPRS